MLHKLFKPEWIHFRAVFQIHHISKNQIAGVLPASMLGIAGVALLLKWRGGFFRRKQIIFKKAKLILI